MKTSSKHLGWMSALLALSGLFLTACMDTNYYSHSSRATSPLSVDASASTAQITITNACVPLLAGQTINVGQVCTAIEGNDLVVTYSTTPGNGWSITEYELWVGAKATDIPHNKPGNPVPGQFPYKGSSLNTGSVVVRVPLTVLGYDPSTVCGASAIIASHAVVKGKTTETAWGAGTRIVPKGNWGTYQTVSFSGNCTTCPSFIWGISYPSPVYDIVGQYANHGPELQPGVTITPGSCISVAVPENNEIGLPAGLILDPNTCVISGTPTTPTLLQGPPSPIYCKVKAQSSCGAFGAVIQIFVAPF